MIPDRILVWAGAVAIPTAIGAWAVITAGPGIASTVPWWVPFTAAFVAGVIAVRRRPGHLGARLLLRFGTLAIVWNAVSYLLVIAAHEGFDGAGMVVANTLVTGLDFAMPASLVALLALYPDGEYRSARQRALIRTLAAAGIVVPLLLLLARPTLAPALTIQWLVDYAGTFAVDSPVHIGALDVLDEPLTGLHEGALGLFPALGVILMLAGIRSAAAAQRRQILWAVVGLGLLAAFPIIDALVELDALPVQAGDIAEIGVLIAIPAALTIGILRPDLLDLPRALRRSFVYTIAWAAIAAVYVGLAAALGIAAGSNSVQIAVLVTFGATLLFQPLWRAGRGRLEQRIYGERPPPEELLRRFGAGLEHTLDTRELAPALAQTIRDGMRLEWVRLSGSHEAVAGEPAGEAVARAELVHGGERLGTIECGARVHGRFGAAERELLETLGRQAALALHNARLAAELGDRLAQIRAQAGELAASRSRIVEAEEVARRRIERDIHDGVQQELVALIARIALARNQLARDPALVGPTLADLQLEARQALDDLRELASGIHPSVLSDLGIVGAIEGRAARLPLGVTIECDRTLRTTRFSETVEGAVFFLVSEAFANALKHSGAERVIVRLDLVEGELRVEISDDGRGFEPAAIGLGTGLGGLADRIEALGGTLVVDSAPGHGTTLTATLSAPARAHA